MEKAKRNSILLKVIIGVLVVVFVLAGVFYGLEKWDKYNGRQNPKDTFSETVVYNGNEYELNPNIETFLVMGLDKCEGASVSDSYNNDKQADFLTLIVFDNAKKEYSAIHINRDTMTAIDVLGVAGNKVDTVEKQIALAHTYGNGKNVSCQNTVNAVSNLLKGTKVNHYISFALDSVAVYNDFVGGVEVEVTDDFTGIDATLIKGEKVVLKGEQALHYVRTRYGLEDSTNSTRMKRQRQYLNALLQKTKDSIAADDEFIVNASLKMSDYIISDRSVTQLQVLAEKVNEYKFNGFKEIEGESKKGKEFIEFYADKEFIEKLVIETFYQIKD